MEHLRFLRYIKLQDLWLALTFLSEHDHLLKSDFSILLLAPFEINALLFQLLLLKYKLPAHS